jgi:hypothetical protein
MTACESKAPCAKLDALTERIDALEAAMSRRDTEISALRTEVSSVSGVIGRIEKIQEHQSVTLDRINEAMQEINLSFRMIAGLPETWAKLQGFWAVMLWLKTHIIPLTFVVALFLFAARGQLGPLIDMVGGK